MSKADLSEKWKKGVSFQQLEDFARSHTQEVFSTLALFVGAISSIFDFFTGAHWSIFFIGLGAIIGIVAPIATEKKLRYLYDFLLQQEKTTQMILGGVKIVIAIFLPFIYFGFLGLLAGTSYHFYVRHAQIIEENSAEGKARRNRSKSEKA